MFFDNLDNIEKIARKTNCSVFAIDESKIPFSPKNSTIITPLKDRRTISIEQIRDLVQQTQRRRRLAHFFVITPGEALTDAAANALLKSIEQPPENCHFVILAKDPTILLPTILSRSQIYYLKQSADFCQPPDVSKKVLELAKQLMVADEKTLPELAKTIAAHKPDPRGFALQIIETSIEIMFKMFCQTNQTKWLRRIPNFIELYENINHNGHIKLHLVADLC